MSDTTPKEVPAEGPFCFENWRRKVQGEARHGVWEIPLYTDAWVTGEPSIGPYSFLNTVPSGHQLGVLQPAVVFRIEDHFPSGVRLPEMAETNESRYHGGELPDELSALLSLALGGRFMPSWVTREFRSEEDRFGSPRAEPLDKIPQLVVRARHPRLPYALDGLPLGGIEVFSDLPKADPNDAMTIVKAARAHHQGFL